MIFLEINEKQGGRGGVYMPCGTWYVVRVFGMYRARYVPRSRRRGCTVMACPARACQGQLDWCNIGSFAFLAGLQAFRPEGRSDWSQDHLQKP